MAKSKREKELVRKLRAGGLRKRSAKLIASASDGRRKPTKKCNAWWTISARC
jgi:hypothetical protein